MTNKNKIINLKISDINLNDDLFRFSYPDKNPILEKSILKNGFTSAITVKENKENFQIISGFRRTLTAEKLNCSNIPAIIFSGTDLDCFNLSISDNLTQRELNIFETAVILNKLIRVFNIDKKEAESGYLPLLGYNAGRIILDNILFINDFSHTQRDNLFSLGIEPDKLFAFKHIDKQTWDDYIEILADLNPSVNKFKQITELIKELAQRENVNELEILRDKQIQTIVKDDKKNSSQKLNLLREELEKRRNPVFTRVTEYFNKNISLLKLSNNIKLNYPSNFEGGQYSVTINFKNKNDLKKSVSELDKVCVNPVLEKVINPLEQLSNDEFI